MATYLILNSVVLLIIAAVMVRYVQWNRALLTTSIILLIATAIFDSLIVSVDIVAYDSSRILGVYIGRAPIEDFAYTLMVALFVPALWHKLRRNDEKT